MPEDAEKPAGRNFNIGDIVLDRDTDEQSRAYVTTLPEATAEDWIAYEDEDEGEGEEITVTEDNPDYPADAPVIVVVHTTNVEYELADWNRYTPLSVDELEEADALYYAFPAPRLVRDKERPHAPEMQTTESGGEPDESSDGQPSTSTLRDIKHVGESRAADLRAAGYESVGDVARADQSGLADVDGIGEARAETMSASATDLLDDQPDSSSSEPTEPDTDTPESRETTDADTDLSAALVALSRYLDGDGMAAEIAADTHSVRVANADHSYRVSLDGVEGDGPHRSELEEAVEKVRANTGTERLGPTQHEHGCESYQTIFVVGADASDTVSLLG